MEWLRNNLLVTHCPAPLDATSLLVPFASSLMNPPGSALPCENEAHALGHFAMSDSLCDALYLGTEWGFLPDHCCFAWGLAPYTINTLEGSFVSQCSGHCSLTFFLEDWALWLSRGHWQWFSEALDLRSGLSLSGSPEAVPVDLGDSLLPVPHQAAGGN